jgi:leucyl/phenylalanyl-tRNA--protein transferase
MGMTRAPRFPVRLTREIAFPAPELATREGLLAIGGDLEPERLLAAYARGIFPWYEEGGPILWWCPDPRFVLLPQELHVSRSLRRRLRSGRFEVRLDTAFREVVRGCAESPRRQGPGTWITRELEEAYARLHDLGVAHSAESWREGRLVGGLYGVALGRVFFGESMFARETDASKVAFVALVGQLQAWGFGLVDCQVPTAHLRRFGARRMARARFLERLAELLAPANLPGPWRFDGS